MNKYKNVVCGATFDFFHKGHELFILSALQKGENVFLGLTTEKYLSKFKSETNVQNFSVRKNNLQEYLKSIGEEKRVKILAIDDPFIPKEINYKEIEAIVVTGDTFAGAQLINKKRLDEGLEQIKILKVPFFLCEDGKKLSSTRIRAGEVDVDGSLFFSSKYLNNDWMLPKHLRESLRVPFGVLGDSSKDIINFNKIYAVGDVTVAALFERGIFPEVGVIDFLVERKNVEKENLYRYLNKNTKILKTKNPPGYITKGLFSSIKTSIYKSDKNINYLIIVDGEEDLAVLPLILLAPLESVIIYGQPKKGTVYINVDLSIKRKARKLLNSFTMR